MKALLTTCLLLLISGSLFAQDDPMITNFGWHGFWSKGKFYPTTQTYNLKHYNDLNDMVAGLPYDYVTNWTTRIFKFDIILTNNQPYRVQVKFRVNEFETIGGPKCGLAPEELRFTLNPHSSKTYEWLSYERVADLIWYNSEDGKSFQWYKIVEPRFFAITNYVVRRFP
jgi:hypothetical protein